MKNYTLKLVDCGEASEHKVSKKDHADAFMWLQAQFAGLAIDVTRRDEVVDGERVIARVAAGHGDDELTGVLIAH